ncbi:hypothetical protein [Allocoleopsis sp.]
MRSRTFVSGEVVDRLSYSVEVSRYTSVKFSNEAARCCRYSC